MEAHTLEERESLPRGRVAPRPAEPYKLWSLLDMNPIVIAKVVAVIGDLSAAKANIATIADVFATLNPSMTDEARETLKAGVVKRASENLQHTEDGLKDIPLSLAARSKFKRLRESLANSTHEIIAYGIQELTIDVAIELSEPLFLMISPEKRKLYEQKEAPFGELVAERFADAQRDIQAASRCLALDEWTACVFHCMRVVELALHAWGRSLDLSIKVPIELANWKEIQRAAELKREELNNSQRSVERDKALEQLGRRLAHFLAIKDAWRNHVAHAREHYDEREAVAVWQHVKEFMRAMVDSTEPVNTQAEHVES